MDLVLTSLHDLYAAHRGKVSDKWSSYLEVYSRVFERFRHSPVRLLEIGIQNGGSLEIYRKYFPTGSVFTGCDINPKCSRLSYGDGIHFVLGDCCAASTRESIAAISSRYDIIIDDGSHRSSDIIKAFLTYFPKLENGGVFLIEDLHASYWQSWEGGLFYTLSSMSFFKLLADAINSEHWGNGKSVDDLFCNEFADYASLVPQAGLREVFSVQFFNSICVVEKCGPATPAGLGRRIVTGTEAAVAPEVLGLNGSNPARVDQRLNPYAQFV